MYYNKNYSSSTFRIDLSAQKHRGYITTPSPSSEDRSPPVITRVCNDAVVNETHIASFLSPRTESTKTTSIALSRG